MKLFADLAEIVAYDQPMADHTWFRLGGPAKYFVQPRTQAQLCEVIKRCQDNAIEMFVLGRGSNVLVADEGIDGAVIHVTDQYFGSVSVEKNIVRAGGGASLNKLLQVCARNGLAGMECLVGIPGSVGGAVKINAGGRFGDIGNVAQGLRLLDSSGYEFECRRPDIFFGYRMTNIMAKFILEAEFELVPDDPERIGRTIKEVWMLKKHTQPVNSRNAGCVFKNPRALSAGAMIDKAGLKGTAVGGAIVSHRHANFIVAQDNTTSTDVLKLIDLVTERVRDRFGVELELELEIWK